MNTMTDRPEDPAIYDFALGEVEEALEVLRQVLPKDSADLDHLLRIEVRLAEAVRLMRGEE